MKKIMLVLLSVMFMAGAGRAVADGPSNYQQAWEPAMNQTSYWSPWVCVKYENHGGQIAAEYDAAIIKGGTQVRVYPDLTEVGEFFAEGPDNPNKPGRQHGISWVMKCRHVPVQPPPTTLPPVVTDPPATTEPPTTEPPVTDPPVTDPPEPPVSVEPTVPVPDTTPAPETPETGTQPPISPTTPDTPPALAETGATTGIIAAIAALLVLTGIGLLFTRKGI